VSGISRVVLVDKPAGPTSFDIVRQARRGFQGRVGHAGTLDPFATGLLVVLMGQATRLSQLFTHLPKEYELTVQFGAVSSTADPMGEIVPTGQRVDRGAVHSALDGFLGKIIQKLPLTSAVKVDGEALYKRAHRGESIETPEREVMIYGLSLLDFDEQAQAARILATTGSGTYLRVLAQDLGATLGVGGYARELRRTRVGHFSVDEAVNLDGLSADLYQETGGGVLSLDEALAFLPRVELAGREVSMAKNGNKLRSDREGRFRVYGDGRLLAVYQAEAREARALVVFPGGV